MSEYLVKLNEKEVRSIGESRWYRAHLFPLMFWPCVALVGIIGSLYIPVGWLGLFVAGICSAGLLGWFVWLTTSVRRACKAFLSEAEKENAKTD